MSFSRFLQRRAPIGAGAPELDSAAIRRDRQNFAEAAATHSNQVSAPNTFREVQHELRLQTSLPYFVLAGVSAATAQASLIPQIPQPER